VHAQGALVLYGRCDEGLSVPYQPFVEALGPYARALGHDRLHIHLGPLAPELGRLLPELGDLGAPNPADPESARMSLFEAVAVTLQTMTRERAGLLVLDDLHWATPPTLLLLRHLLRCDCPLSGLVLCTYRETELAAGRPLAQLLADLHRDAGVERLTIRGLDEAAVAELVRVAIGHELDERTAELARVLSTQTAGNPFFVRELLAHVTESGHSASARSTATQLEVPEGLRQVIAERVARLSDCAQRALRIAAVAGATFSLVLLERVMDDGADVLDAMDEAVTAGLVAEVGHGGYVFAHALVRQTIYGQLGHARRMRLHRHIGEALEAAGNAEAQDEMLAYHFAQAAADGQGGKAAGYALAAGRRATARLGYEEAARHYERGLEALTVAGQPQDERRCELLLALGQARWDAGELDKAREACRQAAEAAETLRDATALARAALAYCGPHRIELDAAETRAVVGLLQRALAALDDGASALRARLMGRLASALANAGVEQRRPLLARQALEMARQVGDKQTLADVLASSHRAIRGPEALHESMAITRELGRVADDLGDGRLRARSHEWLMDYLLELGDIEAVERELDALQRLARTRRERIFTWVLAVLQANRAYLGGRMQQCETLARDALTLRFEGHDELAQQAFSAQTFFVRREQRRLDELMDAVESMVVQHPHFAIWRCALAYVYAQLERSAQARDQLDELAHNEFSALSRDMYWLSSLEALSEVVVILGDAPRAQLLYELLLPYADRCAVVFNLLCQGSVSRSLGQLATTLSCYADAEAHFERALEMNAQIRSPLWIAHTQHDYARMLLLRSDSGDCVKALELLDHALRAAAALSLTALADKAQPLLLEARAAA
jgi:tetratricopeptide (TPR) repeat protein